MRTYIFLILIAFSAFPQEIRWKQILTSESSPLPFGPIKSGAIVPAIPCNFVGEMYVRTGTAELYICSALPNVWTPISSGASIPGWSTSPFNDWVPTTNGLQAVGLDTNRVNVLFTIGVNAAPTGAGTGFISTRDYRYVDLNGGAGYYSSKADVSLNTNKWTLFDSLTRPIVDVRRNSAGNNLSEVLFDVNLTPMPAGVLGGAVNVGKTDNKFTEGWFSGQVGMGSLTLTPSGAIGGASEGRIIYDAVTHVPMYLDNLGSWLPMGGIASGDVSGTWPNLNVVNIPGGAVDIAGIADQSVIKYDLGNKKWVMGSDIVGNTGVAADDLSGTWPNITVVGIQGTTVDNTGIANGKILKYNNVSGNIEWQDDLQGAGGGGITTLNTLVADPQSFAVGSTGTAPNIVSAISTHTFNFPLAATAGVTAGLISKSSYDNFVTAFGATSAATSVNTPNTIVMRDAAGNFAAGTVTANVTGNLAGNATSASALLNDPVGCTASFVNDIAANGTLTCKKVSLDSPVEISGVLAVNYGGFGLNAWPYTYGLVVSGTAATNPATVIQNPTTKGQVLTSFGTGVYPQWQKPVSLNCLSFGVTGDGTTDDTTAIQNCINALPATGGNAFLPGTANSYRITASLHLGNGHTKAPGVNSDYMGIGLVGDASSGAPALNIAPTRLRWDGAGTGPHLIVEGPIGGVRVENILFDCDGTTNDAETAMLVYSASNSVFRHLASRRNTGMAFRFLVRNPAADTIWTGDNILEHISVETNQTFGSGMQLGTNVANTGTGDVLRNAINKLSFVVGAQGVGLEIGYADSTEINSAFLFGGRAAIWVNTPTGTAAGVYPSAFTFKDIYPMATGTKYNVIAATNANPIEIQTSAPHPFNNGDKLSVVGVLGNLAANGYWSITKTAADKFTLTGSIGSGAYTSGGTAGPGNFVVQRGVGPTSGDGFFFMPWGAEAPDAPGYNTGNAPAYSWVSGLLNNGRMFGHFGFEKYMMAAQEEGFYVNNTNSGLNDAGTFSFKRAGTTRVRLSADYFNGLVVGVADGAGAVADKWTFFPDGVMYFPSRTAAQIAGGASNGALVYCSDCTQAAPCAAGGPGAFARREAGAWNCN